MPFHYYIYMRIRTKTRTQIPCMVFTQQDSTNSYSKTGILEDCTNSSRIHNMYKIGPSLKWKEKMYLQLNWVKLSATLLKTSARVFASMNTESSPLSCKIHSSSSKLIKLHRPFPSWVNITNAKLLKYI